jgi:hypothetical protein
LAHVETPFVVVWDADDVMLPGTLSALQSAMQSAPALVAFSAAIIEDPGGTRHRWPRMWINSLVRHERLLALVDCLWSVYPTTGATIMRTAVVRSAGGYGDSDGGDDWTLGVSLAFRGPLGWSERPGRLYRRHSGSVWAQQNSARHLLRRARAVRRRIRVDDAISPWARAALPLIALGQVAAILLHLAVAAARRLRLRSWSTAGSSVEI